MSITQIRQRLAPGFRPFALRTSDGREYLVHHPECILIGTRDVGVLDDEGYIVTLDPLHIVGIKNLPPKKNGAKH
jgi:hypothetical protein